MKKTIFVLIALLALTSLFAVSAAAYPTVEGTPLLLDDAGQEIALQRGKTFLVIGDEYTVVSYE